MIQIHHTPEMNMHAPQSYEAAVELEDIAAIPHNVVSPRHARPLIGVFQDSVVGTWRLTRPTSLFTRREFMNLMMRNKRFTGILPLPYADGKYTGQQVLSQLLPPLNLRMGNNLHAKEDESNRDPANFAIIEQGVILSGKIDSTIYMKPGSGIIHLTYNDYGPKDTSMFLDSLQRLIEDYLVLDGFSVGISDLVTDEDTTKGVQKVIEEAKRKIEALQTEVHMDLFENNTGKTNQQEFEDRAIAILGNSSSASQKALQGSLSKENRLVDMINSGSKGSWTNIQQMVGCLGQQSIENKRIVYGFTDRTLPHYKKYDDGAEARGFIESSFIRGLTPQEFYFHAMSGREGLIDTAVKTADTGYIQRQLIKALEDFVVQHDGTVRDANMNILQFQYGEDGIMATKVENQSLAIGNKKSQEDLRIEYDMRNVDWSQVLSSGTNRPDERVLLEGFIAAILEDQRILIEGVHKKSKFEGSVSSPVNLARLILNMKVRFGLNNKATTTLTPYVVLSRIPMLIERTRSAHVHIWCALLRHYLAPSNIIVKERFTVEAFDALCELIVVNHMKSWVQPGEQVGIVAAQSIGEPSTQLTLNTFHLAGVATKSNVTTGIPRLREILKVTKNPKATSLTIYMKPEHNETDERCREKARELKQDLGLTLLRHITNKVAIYWDPEDVEQDSVLEEDRELLAFYKEIELEEKPGHTPSSKWLLRFELNRDEMYSKNITMADVVFVIQMIYDKQVTISYSDYNTQKLVMRIRLELDTKDPLDKDDHYAALKKFQNKLLNTCVIRGIPGIKAVTFRKDDQQVQFNDGKYEQVSQYVLDTDGTNYVKVMNHPSVDANRLYTTNIYDIMDVLGLEAARAILLNELNPIFAEVSVNYRHFGILCDYITRSGKLMSIDRYGINKNEIGPLGKMSFEETSKIVMNAALFGEVDTVTGVSANVMMGQPFRGGTAFSQILLDDAMLARLSQGLPPVEVEDEEQATDMEDFLEGEQGPCSTANFQVNMKMPRSIHGLDEPDIELYPIEA